VIVMATLSIRNLPDEDHSTLRLCVALHGLSMEAEAHAILHRHAKAGGADIEPSSRSAF